MTNKAIRITGFGGQGVVLSGYIIGSASSIHSDKHATMIQSFGPEARGSHCSATLTVSDEEILYPYINRPEIFIVMSGEGYEKYKDELLDDGILIYEKDLVKATPKKGQPAFGITSTRIAEQLGRKIIQNIVMLGFFAAVTNLVPIDAMRKAVEDSVPKGTEELNLKAFDAGVDYYENEYGKNKGKKKKEASAEAEA